jgi:hypothetical protein
MMSAIQLDLGQSHRDECLNHIVIHLHSMKHVSSACYGSASVLDTGEKRKSKTDLVSDFKELNLKSPGSSKEGRVAI